MTSQAERRRRKKDRDAISAKENPGKPQGRDRRHTNQPADPRKTALEARCRIAGCPITPDAMRASAHPLRGSHVGLCIEAVHDDPATRADLLDTWGQIIKALTAWRQRNTGQTGHPRGASIAMIPDPVETDPGLTVDLRTAAERDAAAKRRAEHWDRIIRALPPQLSGALRGARDGFIDGEAIWRDCAPTQRGRLVVTAIAAAREGGFA